MVRQPGRKAKALTHARVSSCPSLFMPVRALVAQPSSLAWGPLGTVGDTGGHGGTLGTTGDHSRSYREGPGGGVGYVIC